MRLTSRKKEILRYFEQEHLEWVTKEIGPPPYDISGISYLLFGSETNCKRHQMESTRRTLDAMVNDGLLERVKVRESRQKPNGETTATVIRYGLPGHCLVLLDKKGANGAIEGEYTRLD